MLVGDKAYICDFKNCLVYEGIITRDIEKSYRITVPQKIGEMIKVIPKEYVFQSAEKANQTLNEFIKMKNMLCSQLQGFDYATLKRDIKFLCWFETALCFSLTKDWVSRIVIAKTDGGFQVGVCDSRVNDVFFVVRSFLKEDFSNMDEVIDILSKELNGLSNSDIKGLKNFWEDVSKDN